MRIIVFITGSGTQSDFLKRHPTPFCGIRERGRERLRETEAETIKN